MYNRVLYLEYIENKNKEEQLKKKAELAKDVQKKETIMLWRTWYAYTCIFIGPTNQ